MTHPGMDKGITAHNMQRYGDSGKQKGDRYQGRTTWGTLRRKNRGHPRKTGIAGGEC
jgi:hypothetical protein